jgi:hypothetical protein
VDSRVKGARLIAVAVLGFLLFDPPLLTIADDAATVAGIPGVYAYLFAAWALVIALVASIARRR